MTGYQSKRAAAQAKLDSMEREALKLALEALRKSFPPYGIKYEAELEQKHREAITAIKEALAQPAQEQNFCTRCGKRTKDIHTCTPPQENI